MRVPLKVSRTLGAATLMTIIQVLPMAKVMAIPCLPGWPATCPDHHEPALCETCPCPPSHGGGPGGGGGGGGGGGSGGRGRPSSVRAGDQNYLPGDGACSGCGPKSSTS